MYCMERRCQVRQLRERSRLGLVLSRGRMDGCTVAEHVGLVCYLTDRIRFSRLPDDVHPFSSTDEQTFCVRVRHVRVGTVILCIRNEVGGGNVKSAWWDRLRSPATPSSAMPNSEQCPPCDRTELERPFLRNSLRVIDLRKEEAQGWVAERRRVVTVCICPARACSERSRMTAESVSFIGTPEARDAKITGTDVGDHRLVRCGRNANGGRLRCASMKGGQDPNVLAGIWSCWLLIQAQAYPTPELGVLECRWPGQDCSRKPCRNHMWATHTPTRHMD